MLRSLFALLRTTAGSLRDLAPIILVIAFFQLAVLQQPLPNLLDLLVGTGFILVGLTFFIFGLEMGLFPIGESMASALASKGSLFWLVVFAFALGFGTTVAEPALIAVTGEAANAAANAGFIADDTAARSRYATGLRYTVAFSVGLAIVIGVFRIVKGWPIHYLIMGGYAIIVIMTGFAPEEIIGIAYDSGGVTTSTITVPLVTGYLYAALKGRFPWKLAAGAQLFYLVLFSYTFFLKGLTGLTVTVLFTK